jgi:hypothetical protein
MTGAGDIAGFNVSATASFSVSGSKAFSNLNTAVNTLGQATGILVQKPGTFPDPSNYGYGVTSYMFGQQPPEGSVNDFPLATDVTTFGILQSAFVVDPITAPAGGWWRQTYTQPDVALNHPTRWSIPLSTTDPNDRTCLPIDPGSSDADCAALALAFPNNPWTSDFHTMRGLLITGAETSGQGPQLSTATAGDTLQLQARMYNYSLTAMLEGTQVHVRFYGVPWNQGNSILAGPSFLIGEATPGPIPPFDTNTNTPNWLLVGTTFDTSAFDDTKSGDVYLAFWVVVWMEDDSNQLAGEMPGHGLTALPGTLTSLADAAALEETYSNNVGFYKLAFYLFSPPSSTASAEPVASAWGRRQLAVRLGKVEVSSHLVSRGERLIVSTTLHTGEQAIKGGLTLRFYDGDPAEVDRSFDVERVVHLRAHDIYDVRVPFRSDVCGLHTLVVVAGRGTAFEQTRRAHIWVRCDHDRPHLLQRSAR